jgi:DNA-binding XRE family transcriptional regulator
MIRSENEYQEALRRLKQDQEVAGQQRQALISSGLNPDEVERAMQPLLSFQAQLAEEIAWYEDVRRRNFPTLQRLTDIGRMLIALRIASSMTQRELADRLGVNESSVSRDEKNEYHGITLDRAQRILDALGATITATVDEPKAIEADRELMPA